MSKDKNVYNGYRGQKGRDDVQQMLKTAKMAEKTAEAAKLACTDPDRIFVETMNQRIYREFRMFSSLTAELQVLFAKQQPPIHNSSDNPEELEADCMHQLSSQLMVNSRWVADEACFIMEYGIVFSSWPSDNGEDIREIIISLGAQGALISFDSNANDDEVELDGPYIMLSANLLFISSMADWLMHKRLDLPIYNCPGLTFERYVGALKQ